MSLHPAHASDVPTLLFSLSHAYYFAWGGGGGGGGRKCRAACRLGRVNMATAEEVDVEFISNIKELFMKQNKKL
jgi:hypothetical protein